MKVLVENTVGTIGCALVLFGLYVVWPPLAYIATGIGLIAFAAFSGEEKP